MKSRWGYDTIVAVLFYTAGVVDSTSAFRGRDVAWDKERGRWRVEGVGDVVWSYCVLVSGLVEEMVMIGVVIDID